MKREIQGYTIKDFRKKFPNEAAALDFDFVVLAQRSSTTVTADLSFPLAFQFIPILVVGEGSGVFTATMSRTNTSGELIYMFQRFPGVPGTVWPDWATDFSIGITPRTLSTTTKVTLGPGWAMGYVITGILVSPETPPYGYTVSLSF